MDLTARGCDSAKIEQVIVTKALKGSGTENCFVNLTKRV